jgi:CBS domain containing-hemolysin-like protein
MSDNSNDTGSEDPSLSSSLRFGAPFRGLLKVLRRKRSGDALRETLEELIEETPSADSDPQAESERQLLTNILNLHNLKVGDVMVPRADIVAIDCTTGLHDLITFMSREGHSRLPVYREELDDILGMVHVKDVLPFINKQEEFSLQQVVRDVIIVAPSMPILDLLVEMRQSRRHMALVVDEFGGIDGLVTIEDLVEEIVGEIEDEHDEVSAPQLALKPDGSLMADGRLPLDELEGRTGRLLDDEARDSVETLGGLLSFIVGRVPGRGELIRHDSGIEFEVIEADSRRVKRVRIRNLPPVSGEAA